MAEFFSFLKVFLICGTVLILAFMALLSLPQSKLRAVGLELAKYAMAAGLLLLIPSPVDLIPDVVPGIGWLDDVGYVVAAIASVRSALGERKKRLLYDELEVQELQDRTRK
ncbi:MAG: DUF1232 domain-containing protein [Tepidisphaera sp.]|nr:MAG: DUF1232 domain-containing protein [Cyanobacteria bacterium CYA]MBI1191502.1 DUF1232 domain-containing protein [Tepidisphaera sp.]